MNEALYQAHLLSHSQQPRNKGVLEDADITHKGQNPSCGDELTLYLKYDGDTISEVSFDGIGCAVSTAAASLLTERLKGLTRTEAMALTEADVYDMLKVEIHAGRVKCALLALNTLKEALQSETPDE